ncbi:hypothetical protein [Bacillus sp. ISTL8]|uniref:hypothetical protein n=1 Tax=Bacillus sp. ISTL8 TaxID=2596896 RepID=UPI0014577965|nr:hypothetical protein [Bacillus sp. ISTL8]
MRLCQTAITIESLSTMKGFNELTQGEERVQDMLLHNCLELRGQSVGFKKTRIYVVTNEFSRNTLEEFANLATNDGHLNKFFLMIMQGQVERILRHYVPSNYIADFAKATKKAVNEFGFERTCDGIEKYFTCGTVDAVKDTYKRAVKYLEEGVVPVESTTIN